MPEDPRTATATPADAVLAAALARPWRCLIGGALRDGGAEPPLEVVNPARDEVIARVPVASAGDLDDAITAARAAQPAWAALSGGERGAHFATLCAALEKRAEELAVLDAATSGNTIRACRDDVAMALRKCTRVAEVAGSLLSAVEDVRAGRLRRHQTLRQPHGVVAAIMPFNHPLVFAVQAMFAAAAGNTVVLKPSEQAPLSAVVLGELLAEVFPPGVCNIVCGRGDVGAAMVAHPAVDFVSFIGSVEVGRAVIRESAVQVRPMLLELGGKNPMVVLPDADVDVVAAAAVRSLNVERCQGQSCNSTSRLLVHGALADDVVAAVAERMHALRIGDPLEETTQVGSLVSRRQRERVENLVDSAIREGAQVVTGGRDAAPPTGGFVAPTVLDGVEPWMTAANEEIFGPVLSVLRWDDEEAMLGVANSTRYGLTATVWSRDLERAARLGARIDSGRVIVNAPVRTCPDMEYGHHRESGLGTVEGPVGLLSFTRVTSLHIGQETDEVAM